MAKVKEGARSMLSGKADGLVYVQFSGGAYTRKVPKRNKDSWTPRMLLNLQRFKEVNSFCGQFKYSVIPQIWNGAAVKMSGYAFFLKSNMSAFAADGTIADPKKLRFSTGKLTMPEGLVARLPELGGSIIEVSWPKVLNVGGARMLDELMVISAAKGRYSELTYTGIVRMDLHGSFELPQLPIDSTHLYLFFGSKDRQDYSESVCFEI